MNTNATAARMRAEARFGKSDDRRLPGAQALSEQAADARATQEKTARLKALRLAKEAAELAAAPPPAPKKSAAKTAKPRVKAASRG